VQHSDYIQSLMCTNFCVNCLSFRHGCKCYWSCPHKTNSRSCVDKTCLALPWLWLPQWPEYTQFVAKHSLKQRLIDCSKQFAGHWNVIVAVSIMLAAAQECIQSCTIIRQEKAQPWRRTASNFCENGSTEYVPKRSGW